MDNSTRRNENSSHGLNPKKPLLAKLFTPKKILAFLLFSLAVVYCLSIQAELTNKKVLRKAWSVVRESLTSEDSQVREMAVQGLEFIEGDQVVNALKSSLDDQSEYVQIWAARSLAREFEIQKPMNARTLRNDALRRITAANPIQSRPVKALVGSGRACSSMCCLRRLRDR